MLHDCDMNSKMYDPCNMRASMQTMDMFRRFTLVSIGYHMIANPCYTLMVECYETTKHVGHSRNSGDSPNNIINLF